MSSRPLQTQIIESLRRSPATAEVLSILLDADVGRVECELEQLFANSKVECARDGGPLYRLVVRNPTCGTRPDRPEVR